MSSIRIPVLIVGTGFGCRIQVPAFRAAGFDVVGLVGTDAQRTAERAYANSVRCAFTDLRRAIRETGAQVVAVATPPHTHSDIVIEALSHECHVLCEKPFASDVFEARCMLEAQRRAGKICLPGNEFRFLPQRAMQPASFSDGVANMKVLDAIRHSAVLKGGVIAIG